MEDREPLLPKTNGQPSSDNVISENYQSRRYESIERPQLNSNYSSIDESPQIIQPGGTRALIEPINSDSYQRVPSDYSGYAWLSVLFCCFPLSICAIYKSNKVLICIRRGDLEEARVHSRAAKKLSALAIIYGVLFIVVTIGIYFVIAVNVTHTIN